MTLIYISGIDGCGKTTQAKILVKKLMDRGLDAEYKWLRWEPFLQKLYRFPKVFLKTKPKSSNIDVIEIENSEHRQWVSFKKKVLSNAIFKMLWWNHACFDYFIQNRKRLKENDAKITIIDRYVDDFLFDQACNFGVPPKECHKLRNNTFLKKMARPDFKIFIDLPASVGYARKSDGTPLEYLKEREQYYQNCLVEGVVFHVNGERNIETVALEIENWVTEKLDEVLK